MNPGDAALVYDKLCPGWREAKLVAGNRRVSAPYREDVHPSLDIHPGKLTWYDRGLAQGGGARDLAVKMLGAEEASLLMRRIGSEGHVRSDPPAYHSSEDEPEPNHEIEILGPPTTAQIARLKRSRRLMSGETLEAIGVNLVRGRFRKDGGPWSPWSECLGFPALGGSWKVFAIDANGLPRIDERGLKKRNAGPVSIVASPALMARADESPQILDVEGETDFLAALEAGFVNVLTSTGGAGNVAGHKREQGWLKRRNASHVVVIRDADDPGKAGSVKSAEWWLAQGVPVREVELPDGLDLRDFLNGSAEWDGSDATEPLGNADALRQLIEAAPVREPDPTVENAERWGELKSLPPAHEPVPTLVRDALPDVLANWAWDACERLSISIEYTAPQVVFAVGAAIMRRLGICPKRHDNWLEVPNLWACTVAPPGALKSPARAEAIRPLRMVASELREEFEEQSAKHKSLQAIAKAKLESAKGAAKKAADKGGDLEAARVKIERAQRDLDEAEVHPPRLITSDSTTEKLGELLLQNPHGIAIVRDELAGLLSSFEKQGREGDRAFYLESWDGKGGHDVDRIGRGSLRIPAVCVAISGTIQPNRLAAYLRPVLSGGSADDGLFQRLQLAVYPGELGQFENIDREPDREAFGALHIALRRLVNLDTEAASEERVDGVSALRFTSEAQQLFDAWFLQLESRLRSGDLRDAPAFEAHLSKYRGLMPALALIFHAAEWAGDPASEYPVPPVSLRAAQMAAAWCDYLERHAERIYGLELRPAPSAARALSDRIRSGQLRDGMTVRDIQRREWPGLERAGVIHAGLEVLEAANWARVDRIRVDGKTPGGRHSEVVSVNPILNGGRDG